MFKVKPPTQKTMLSYVVVNYRYVSFIFCSHIFGARIWSSHVKSWWSHLKSSIFDPTSQGNQQCLPESQSGSRFTTTVTWQPESSAAAVVSSTKWPPGVCWVSDHVHPCVYMRLYVYHISIIITIMFVIRIIIAILIDHYCYPHRYHYCCYCSVSGVRVCVYLSARERLPHHIKLLIYVYVYSLHTCPIPYDLATAFCREFHGEVAPWHIIAYCAKSMWILPMHKKW